MIAVSYLAKSFSDKISYISRDNKRPEDEIRLLYYDGLNVERNSTGEPIIDPENISRQMEVHAAGRTSVKYPVEHIVLS